jgi:outer membrane protein insertion porin family
MNLIKCHKCGKEISIESKFCDDCSTTVDPKKLNLNAELYVPFPGAGPDRTLRLYGFVDVGNVYGENDPYKLNELRSSVGIGVSWISPLGPLRLSYAKAIKKFEAKF